MRYEMICQSPFPMVRLNIKRGEKFIIEPGSMVYCESSIEFDWKLNRQEGGGFFAAIGRALAARESLFITEITTMADNAVITLGAKHPGMVHVLSVGEEQWILQDGVFLACDGTAFYKIRHQPREWKEIFLSASVNHFMMETVGHGDMLITSCGAIHEVPINGETVVFDNTHVVAWTTGVTFKPRIMWNEAGTGFVYDFSGFGKVLVQSCCRATPSTKGS